MTAKILILFSILFLSSSLQQTSNYSVIDMIQTFLYRGGKQLEKEFPDKIDLKSDYDFIVIGAGSAGCAVASRLSENPEWKVLLIEAGPKENLLMDVPMMVHYLQGYNINWGYKTERSERSCLAMNNNQCNWPRGKVMGGSSVLNYMIYTRGNRRDYDNWAALGNPGWDFKNVSKYFRKLENNIAAGITPDYHGKHGPVTISSVKYKTNVAKAFVDAGLEKGFPYVDYNGPQQIGFSFLQTTTKNGTRQSTNVAYLYPISNRKNLHVKRNSHVVKLLIDENKKAYGVKFFSGGRVYSVNAKKEIILSAGAINTPQILMLSGIGPKKHLKQLGIETIMNLAVGYNLMDHTATGALTFTVNTTTLSQSDILDVKHFKTFTRELDGPLILAGGVESVAFIDTERPNDPDGYPDLELMQLAGGLNSDPVFKRNFGIRDDVYNETFGSLGEKHENFMVFPLVLRPKSRGRIKLRSNNPFAHPIILPNYFSEHYDIEISIRGIRRMIDLLDTDAFRKLNAEIYKAPVSGCKNYEFNSDAYWECYTRHFTFTIYHHCGTAKMGPATDKRAVVDPTLKVYGIEGLRVADASIIPEIISGHTNAPSIMIGEKAADMIKQSWAIK